MQKTHKRKPFSPLSKVSQFNLFTITLSLQYHSSILRCRLLFYPVNNETQVSTKVVCVFVLADLYAVGQWIVVLTTKF